MYLVALIRWDVAELDQLPDYVKVCFKVFYDNINQVAEVAEREHGISVLPYFQKAASLAKLCLIFVKTARLILPLT